MASLFQNVIKIARDANSPRLKDPKFRQSNPQVPQGNRLIDACNERPQGPAVERQERRTQELEELHTVSGNLVPRWSTDRAYHTSANTIDKIIISHINNSNNNRRLAFEIPIQTCSCE